MKLCRAVFVLGFLFWVSSATAGELYVASWNVENLFDTIDDPDVEGDEEFTPEGPKKWDMARYKNKLRNLARAIKDMNGKKGPDILGVCEIENRTVLEDLVKELATLDRDYRIVHKDSPSNRGIDCAILYDRSRVTLGKPTFHNVPAGKTRDIVEADFTIEGKKLTVFMNHWPSRSTNPEEQRFIAARTLRTRLDTMLAAEPAADIVLLGDFNDYPISPSIQKHLRAHGDKDKLGKGDFYNTTWPVMEAGKGTYVFKNKWDVIDHILVSPGLLDKEAFRWKAGSTAPVELPYLIYTPTNAKQIPRPNKMFAGNAYFKNGSSDHLPIGCILEY